MSDLSVSHLYLLCVLLICFIVLFSKTQLMIIGKHVTSDILPQLSANWSWCLWINLMHECGYVHTTSRMFSVTPYKHILSCCLPPPHLSFCSHLCVLCTNSFWTIWNVENRKLKFLVSEITFYQWMSAVKKSGVKMAPLEVGHLWHVLAFLVSRAGLVCGFTLSLHPVLQQLVLCKLLDFVWAPLGEQWSWYVFHSLNCVQFLHFHVCHCRFVGLQRTSQMHKLCWDSNGVPRKF